MGINELMELNVKKNMILIGELSKKTGITTSAINFYTKKGLLNPPKKLNRTRALYPKSDIKKIKEIKQLKRQGLTLIGIKGIIDGKSNLKINSHQSMKKNMYTVEEFIKDLGIDKKFYSYLIEKKLINNPSKTDERIFFHNRRDIVVGRAYINLLLNGLNENTLNKHIDYLQLSVAEAIFLQEHLELSKNPNNPDSNQEIINSFNIIRRYLRENELRKLNL